MATLLLRLAGPMQAWGTQSRFNIRDSDLDPSFSGVVGLIAAALGRPRDAPIDDLAALGMGVRVERQGTRLVDYQTAGGAQGRGERYGVFRADGGRPGTVVSYRYYLADADFLVGLEGEVGLLETIDAGLSRPVWAPSLGRRSFPPSLPVRVPDGLRSEGLEDVLSGYPWYRRHDHEEPPNRLRLVLPASAEEGAEVRMDVPLSFSDHGRAFAPRYIRTKWIPVPEVR
jgi:CRISPR system Cascade subunit CasD